MEQPRAGLSLRRFCRQRDIMLVKQGNTERRLREYCISSSQLNEVLLGSKIVKVKPFLRWIVVVKYRVENRTCKLQGNEDCYISIGRHVYVWADF